MQKFFSIRWKIMAGLLILAILPMLLLTYMFSDMAAGHNLKQVKQLADHAGYYIMQGTFQSEKSLSETLKLLKLDEALLKGIHNAQLKRNPERLNKVMEQKYLQLGFDRLELISEDGNRYIIDKTINNGQPYIEKDDPEAEQTEYSDDIEQLAFADDRLVISASTPLNYQGSFLGTMRAFRFLDDQLAQEYRAMTDAKVAFHNGNRIIASSLDEMKTGWVNLQDVISQDGITAELQGKPHIIFNYPLNKTVGFLLALDISSIKETNLGLQRTLLLTCALVIVAAILFGLIISGNIAKPIDSVVRSLQEIAEGEADLTSTINISTNDEIGKLASNFNLFVQRLRGIVENTREAVNGLGKATISIRSRSSEVSRAAAQQTTALEKAHQNITEIGNNSGEIADSVSNLVASVQQSAAATHQLDSSTRGITEQMENLFGTINDISNSIHQLSSSNEQIDSSIMELSENARETSKSAKELENATSNIEKSAEQTSRLAQQAATDALEGKAAVQDTIHGISELEEMMEKAYLAIQDLGERSDAIGSIINVIAEIADQTNLLSLNAAIIAAQAGEHGQGFAVVAQEIRELAERTSVSTKEIAEIIENLQQGTKTAVATIEAGTLRAQQEVARSATAGQALEKLHESSLVSTEQITGIASQTQKQSEENRTIAQTMLGITRMLEQIVTAINQQTASTRTLSDAAELMKSIAAKVKNSTTEQGRGTQQIAQSMEHILQTIELIDSATRAQRERNTHVIESVATVRRIAEENATRAGGMNSSVENLLTHTGLLKQEIGAFKTSQEQKPAAEQPESSD